MAGLPKVMQARREQMKLDHPELVEQQQQQHVLIPITPSVEKPANEEAPVVVEEPEEAPMSLEKQWELKSKQWEDKYRSLQGVVENLEPTVRSEKEMRLKLERELQELREAMPKPEEKPDMSDELTAQELEVYGGSQSVIEKVARKIARGELKSALSTLGELRKELKDLREASGRVETGVHQSEEERFLDRVREAIPKFDAITTSREWREDYLNRPVPYTDMVIHEALSDAHVKRNLKRIKDIFAGFKPSKETLATMTSPALNGGAAPIDTSGGGKKPILKWSDRKRMSEDLRMGRIKTKEQRAEWDAWDKMFKEAEAEGRIDMSK
jgi:hypothetical protein